MVCTGGPFATYQCKVRPSEGHALSAYLFSRQSSTVYRTAWNEVLATPPFHGSPRLDHWTTPLHIGCRLLSRYRRCTKYRWPAVRMSPPTSVAATYTTHDENLILSESLEHVPLLHSSDVSFTCAQLVRHWLSFDTDVHRNS